jgi:hypothetical protein
LTTRSLFPPCLSSKSVIIRRSVVGNISSIVRTSSAEYGGGGGFGIADGECWGSCSDIFVGRDDNEDAAAPLEKLAFASEFTTGVPVEPATGD